ncbi:MAG: redoxin domain-containing protein [Planctomycetaceae bacterium]|nr:redoxin domain-containing protein [Planctomycetaceae bacterium]
MMADKRIWILPIAAVVIFGLCVWRISHPRESGYRSDVVPQLRRPAPSFQLYDQNSTLVNLESFLHRHVIVLIFFDGQAGPDADPCLTQFRNFHAALKKEGIIVLGISTALPQQIRNSASAVYPFPLLSDAAASDRQSVHRVWNRIIEPPTLDQPAGTKPGIFVIDRTGLVSWDENGPVPEVNPDQVLSQILSRSQQGLRP